MALTSRKIFTNSAHLQYHPRKCHIKATQQVWWTYWINWLSYCVNKDDGNRQTDRRTDGQTQVTTITLRPKRPRVKNVWAWTNVKNNNWVAGDLNMTLLWRHCNNALSIISISNLVQCHYLLPQCTIRFSYNHQRILLDNTTHSFQVQLHNCMHRRIQCAAI